MKTDIMELERLKGYFAWDDKIKEAMSKKLFLYGVTDIEGVLKNEDATYIVFESDVKDLTLSIYSDHMSLSYKYDGRMITDEIFNLADTSVKRVSYSHHLAVNAYQKMKAKNVVTVTSNQKMPRKHF